MHMKEIFPDLTDRFEYEYLGFHPLSGGQQLMVKKPVAKPMLDFLFRNQEFWCDYLVSISGEHRVTDKECIILHYHLVSIITGFHIHLQTQAEVAENEVAIFDSVSDIWKTANWHEREAGELFGIKFQGHPYQRNLLLPATWQGFPLRKNYLQQDSFHGVQVKY